jgi:hypothetical protein
LAALFIYLFLKQKWVVLPFMVGLRPLEPKNQAAGQCIVCFNFSEK